MSLHKYNDGQLARLRDIPIVKVLASGELGTFSLAHTAKGVYKSPFREETTPSFHIDETLNRWYDYGQGDGGDVIKLVQLLGHKNFVEACDFLAGFEPGKVVVNAPVIDEARPQHGRCHHEVLAARDLLDGELLEYITKVRHIPLPLARRYCRQITYSTVFEDGHKFNTTSFGFENLHGEYTVRNMSTKSNALRYVEMGALNVSVINADGSRPHIDPVEGNRRPSAATIAPTSGSVMVFEGFIDFLSFLAWTSDRRREGVPETSDVVVLNSVANVRQTLEYLASHGSVFTYLDNDNAGKKATAEIRDYLERNAKGVSFRDVSPSYAGHNDVNEAYVAFDRRRQAEEMASRNKPVHTMSEHAALNQSNGIK